MIRTSIFLLCCFFSIGAFSQTSTLDKTFINRALTDSRYSLDSSYTWVHSATFSNGDIAVIAHDKNSDDADIKLFKIAKNGTISWEKTIDESDVDYGVRVLVDASDNVFLVATFWNMHSDQDLKVIKYNSSGAVQWTMNWDGGQNLGDVPVDAALDANGDLFVTGIANMSTENITSDEDYFTLKINSGGTLDWDEIFDQANLSDIPVGIAVNNDYVFVTGSAFASPGDRQTTTLKYHKITGTFNQLISKISSDDEYATGIRIDDDDNVYVTGRSHNGQNFDAYLVKYTDNFYKIWDLELDGFGRDDRSLFCELNNNKVYLAAEGKNTGNDLSAFLYQLDTNGSSLDTLVFEPVDISGSCTWADMAFSANHFYAILNVNNTDKGRHGLIINFDDQLNELTQKTCSFKDGLDLRQAHWLNDGMFMCGAGTETSGSTVVSKYWHYNYLDEIHGDSVMGSDTVEVVKNVLIVSLNPRQLNLSNIDNTLFVSGKPSDFLSAAAVDSLELSFGWDEDSFQLAKMTPSLTSADTMVTSRAGRKFRTHDGYCHFELYFPENYGVQQANSAAENCWAFSWSHPKTMAHLTNGGYHPNDPKFAQFQFSLKENSSADKWQSLGLSGQVSINMIEAWRTLDYTGNTDVTVAVVEGYPSGKHEEFLFQDSIPVIRDYIDEFGDTLSVLPQTFSGHATSTAGTIAALRNNGKGVSGVAGGSANHAGVNIVAFKKTVGASIMHPANHNIPIINCSWADTSVHGRRNYIDLEVLKIYNQGSTIIAGRGNDGKNRTTRPATCFPFVISVGAYGMNGNYRYYLNDDPDKLDWAKPHKGYSSYGNDMDFLGPGCTALTHGPNIQGNNNRNIYMPGNMTSTAAPHAAGLAALLYGYTYNAQDPRKNLYPEDLEILMELGTVDLTLEGLLPADTLNINQDHISNSDPQSVYRPMPSEGYDDLTGWGRMNAANTANYIDKKSNRIIHFFDDSPGVTVTNVDGKIVPEESGVPLDVNTRIDNQLNIDSKGDRHKISFTVDFTLPPHLAHWKIANISWHNSQGIWPLQSESGFYKANDSMGRLPIIWRYLSLDSIVDSNTVIFSGYVYHITHEEKGRDIYWPLADPYWIPFHPDSVGTSAPFAFSVHIYNDSFAKVQQSLVPQFDLYPNPANQHITVVMDGEQEVENLKVLSLTGQCVYQSGALGKIRYIDLPLAALAPGAYMVQLQHKNGLQHKKFIKE